MSAADKTTRLLLRRIDGNKYAAGSSWEEQPDTFELGGARLQMAVAAAQRDGFTWLTVGPAPSRYHGRCYRCKRTVTRLLEERVLDAYDNYRHRRYVSRAPIDLADANRTASETACPDCGATVRLKRLEGTHKPEVPCDARCTNAKGPNCECSCGGANHGAAWA